MKNLKRFISVFLLLLVANNGFAQAPAVSTFKLYLIGDTGENDTTGNTLKSLRVQLLNNPNSAVIFLGDNCYKKFFYGLLGFQLKGYDGSKLTKAKMMSQLNILRGYKGSVYFIPGNHDWWNGLNLKRGKKHLLLEQKFIEDTLKNFTSLANHNTGTFLPENGSPGPVSKDFNDGKTRVIFVDTYRLILEESKKRHKDTVMLNKFYDDLKEQLNDASKKKEKIIVVAHHPIHAKGKHSLPLVYWQKFNRRFGDANTNYPPYNKVATQLDSLLKAHHHPDVYYVSGHEHSLEYFFNDSLHYLVSGAGSKVDKVLQEPSDTEAEYLVWEEQGFFEIAFYGRYETILMYHKKNEDADMKVRCLGGCSEVK